MPVPLLAALAICCLASNSPLARAGVTDGTDPMAFAAIRVAAGAAMLLIITRGRAPLRGTRRWGAALALMVYLVGFSLAYRGLDAGLGALILFATVQLGLLGAGLARGEGMTPRRAAGSVVALGGLAWLLWPGGDVVAPAVDSALMIVAGLAWAAYSFAGKYESAPIPATAGNFVFGTVAFAALAPVWWGAPVTPLGAVCAMVSGAVTSGLGYAMLYRVLPRLTLSVSGVMQLAVPVVATIMGAAVLGEMLTPRAFAAGALTLGGVALATLQPTRRSKGS